MDQIKIGKFMAEMRKEQNLTQQDLAEKLGISNKTVSKWECGNGMPDYAVMESLCNILKTNVNELLSGERLPSQEYSKKAEENMISLIQESSQNYKHEKREWVRFMIGIVTLIFVVWLTIIMWGGIESVGHFIDYPIFIYVMTMTVLVMGIARMLKDFIKAFPLALKKLVSTEIRQVKKSLLAVKTAMITINVEAAHSSQRSHVRSSCQDRKMRRAEHLREPGSLPHSLTPLPAMMKATSALSPALKAPAPTMTWVRQPWLVSNLR